MEYVKKKLEAPAVAGTSNLCGREDCLPLRPRPWLFVNNSWFGRPACRAVRGSHRKMYSPTYREPRHSASGCYPPQSCPSLPASSTFPTCSGRVRPSPSSRSLPASLRGSADARLGESNRFWIEVKQVEIDGILLKVEGSFTEPGWCYPRRQRPIAAVTEETTDGKSVVVVVDVEAAGRGRTPADRATLASLCLTDLVVELASSIEEKRMLRLRLSSPAGS